MLSEKGIQKHVDAYWDASEQVSISNQGEGQETIWRLILEQVYKDREDILYKRDKDGNLEYNDKGLPKINIVSIVLNLAKLIASFLVESQLRAAYKK